MKDIKETPAGCDEVLEYMLESLGMNKFSSADLEALCLANPACEKLIKESYHLWYEMDAMRVPEPSEEMRGAFLEVLADFEKEEQSGSKKTIQIDWNQSFKWAAVFIIGLLIGLLVQQEPTSSRSLVVENTQVSTLLAAENTSTDRLLAIQQIKEIQHPEDAVIDALHHTLMRDPNVNVRLSAIEAMVHFIDHPKARTSLVSALPYQTSPLVQLTLAQLLINLQSDQNVEELKKLLNYEQLDNDVKLQLKETLNVL